VVGTALLVSGGQYLLNCKDFHLLHAGTACRWKQMHLLCESCIMVIKGWGIGGFEGRKCQVQSSVVNSKQNVEPKGFLGSVNSNSLSLEGTKAEVQIRN
jgi:hypothetical protein